jgi:hypothetical protein
VPHAISKMTHMPAVSVHNAEPVTAPLAGLLPRLITILFRSNFQLIRLNLMGLHLPVKIVM